MLNQAEQFIGTVESQLLDGRFIAGQYDLQVISNLRSIWGAKIDATTFHPAYVFADGSKCIYNKDYEDWFLI
jgi:hypothetical protein